jgi:aminoglycoside N3'-acetyltransferase
MADFRRILDQLGIDSSPLFFVQSSTEWLKKAGIGSSEVLTALEERLEKGGTIVMPSYPFSGWHEDFLRSEPYVNLATSPAQTGMLAEMLRRRHESIRSLDPDLPLVAWGEGASAIAGSRPAGEDPTGADSAFSRVVDSGGFLLGLGVSLNYMALIHVFDSRYRFRYPHPILSDQLYSASSEDKSGNIYAIKKRAVPAALQQRIRPSKIISELPKKQDFFHFLDVSGVSFFSWKLRDLDAWACKHIESRLKLNKLPCWLDEYSDFLSDQSCGKK